MYFRNARLDELNKIYALYKSVIGGRFCTWNDDYPGMQEIKHDFETDNLFVMISGEELVGAASIVPENEMDDLPFWKTHSGNECEIARIVVAKSFRGNGFAENMVNRLIDILKCRGCDTVRLSVATVNIPALSIYRKIGFNIVGNSDMYKNHYILMEKTIKNR